MLHSARVEQFLCKDVTHVITKELMNSIRNTSKDIPGLMKCTRAIKMVQLAQMKNCRACPDMPVLNRQSVSIKIIEKMCQQCASCPVLERPRHSNKAHPSVRKLRGNFIKVEDLARRYQPMVMEYEVWPYMDLNTRDPGSPFSLAIKIGTVANKRRLDTQYCELCDMTVSNISKHLKGRQHQKNANNDERYAGLDNAISNGPSVYDLLK